MRLDVTSAKMRKRLVAELSAQPAPAHEAANLPEGRAQPRPSHPAAQRVKWAQAALSVLLGLRLPLDGVLGATTQVAIRRFQAQSGLPQTGALDAATELAIAKAIGHPAPGMTEVHKVMPRWFRLERQALRPKAPSRPAKPADVDGLAAPPTPQVVPTEAVQPTEAHKPAPVLPDAALHQKTRAEELP